MKKVSAIINNITDEKSSATIKLARKFYFKYQKPVKKIEKTLKAIGDSFNWENYQDEKTGKYWAVKEALYCKLSWVLEFLIEQAKKSRDPEAFDEYVDIIIDTQKVIDALPKTI